MSGRQPLDQALGFFKSELEQHGPLPELSVGQAWSAFRRFAQQRFDTPSTPESDGLLFQYGTHSFYGSPMFLVGLTRQFEVNDPDSEHDHFVHILCELRYRPDAALERLSSFNRWFFHDTNDNLDHWAQSLSQHLELLPGRRQDEVHLAEESV